MSRYMYRYGNVKGPFYTEDYQYWLIKGKKLLFDKDLDVLGTLGSLAVQTHNYVTCKGVYVHRIITGADGKQQVDHINGDTLDNRTSNLRLVSRSQNQQNRGPQSNNKSGVPGVYWSTRDNLWKVQISVNKKTTYVGQYKELKDAVKARAEAVIRHYGEYGRVVTL